VVIGNGVSDCHSKDTNHRWRPPREDPGRVVGVRGQRPQMRAFFGNASRAVRLVLSCGAGRRCRRARCRVAGAGPRSHGRRGHRRSCAPYSQKPRSTRGFVVGVKATTRLGPKLIVGGERQKARIVNGLLPSHPSTMALRVVLAHLGCTADKREVASCPSIQRVQVTAFKEAVILAMMKRKNVAEGLHIQSPASLQVKLCTATSHSLPFPGPVTGRFPDSVGVSLAAQLAYPHLDRAVAAWVSSSRTSSKTVVQ